MPPKRQPKQGNALADRRIARVAAQDVNPESPDTGATDRKAISRPLYAAGATGSAKPELLPARMLVLRTKTSIRWRPEATYCTCCLPISNEIGSASCNEGAGADIVEAVKDIAKT